MPWSNFDYETQLKVIDRIDFLSEQEDNWKVANALKAASQELQMWCNNKVYAEERIILDDFLRTGETPRDVVAEEIIKDSRNARVFIALLFAAIGATLGSLMINRCSSFTMIIGAVMGGIAFATIGSAITKRRK